MRLSRTCMTSLFCRAGLFDQRLAEYRYEMEQMSPGLKQNFKDVGKKLKNFFVESGQIYMFTTITFSVLVKGTKGLIDVKTV